MKNYAQLISLGAFVALIGYITSGPVGFLIVRLVKPQPAWTSPSVFAGELSCHSRHVILFRLFIDRWNVDACGWSLPELFRRGQRKEISLADFVRLDDCFFYPDLF